MLLFWTAHQKDQEDTIDNHMTVQMLAAPNCPTSNPTNAQKSVQIPSREKWPHLRSYRISPQKATLFLNSTVRQKGWSSENFSLRCQRGGRVGGLMWLDTASLRTEILNCLGHALYKILLQGIMYCSDVHSSAALLKWQNLKIKLWLSPKTSAKPLNHLRIWFSHQNGYFLECSVVAINIKSSAIAK